MAIQSTKAKTSVNFGNAEENQKKKGNGGKALGTAIVAGGGVGLATYALAKKEPTATDVFAAPGKYISGLSAEEMKLVKPILDAQANLPKEVEKRVLKEFGKKKTEKRIWGYSKKKLEKGLNKAKNKLEKVKAKLNKGKTGNRVKKAFEKAEFLVNEFEDTLKFMDDKRIVKRDAYKTHLANRLQSQNLSKMDEVLKKIGGKLPKIADGKKAALFGVIAAVVGFIGAKMLGKPKEQPVIAQEMQETTETPVVSEELQAPETVATSESAPEATETSEGTEEQAA